MNRVSFHLKRRDAQKPQSVFALYYVGRRAAKIYTGISVNPKNWNPTRQRLKASDTYAAIYNGRLDQIETDILSIVRDLENAHTLVTPERIRSQYNTLVHKTTDREVVFLDAFADWIEGAKGTRSPTTIGVYEGTKQHLENYAASRGVRLTFDRMDKEFLKGFIDYLTRRAKLQNSSLWKEIKTWKTFMKWALDNGHTTERFFESVTKSSLSKWGFAIHDPVMVRLTEEELQSIADVDLSDLPELDNARNLFVLQCTLGVRFGDLQKLAASPADYVSGSTVRLITQKNRKVVSIPLLGAARHMLEHRAELRTISNAKMNEYIKEVARRAGIVEPVVVTEFRGVNRADAVKEKYRAITTHTAKRTFVTLMVARGISTEVIMKVTGNSRGTIDRYIYLNDHDVQREMRKAENLLTL